MRLILSKQCKSLTGSVGRGFGYHIQRRGERFYGVRNTKGDVPSSGHIRFILACAKMAQMALHITDIAVPRQEFIDALREAGMRNDADYYTLHPEELTPCTSRASLREPQKKTLNAKQVIDFAEKYKLEEVLKRKKSAVTFAQLTARLERAIHADVGERGLNILLYGWICKYGKVSRPVLNLRKHRGGEYWLTAGETEHFSNYAGYDLTKE